VLIRELVQRMGDMREVGNEFYVEINATKKTFELCSAGGHWPFRKSLNTRWIGAYSILINEKTQIMH